MEMTNQDDKLNEEIWEEEEISSVELIDFNRESRLMNKARQQGIDSVMDKTIHNVEEIETEAYNRGAEAERKRIFTLHDKNMDKFIIELCKFRKEANRK